MQFIELLYRSCNAFTDILQEKNEACFLDIIAFGPTQLRTHRVLIPHK